MDRISIPDTCIVVFVNKSFCIQQKKKTHIKTKTESKKQNKKQTNKKRNTLLKKKKKHAEESWEKKSAFLGK